MKSPAPTLEASLCEGVYVFQSLDMGAAVPVEAIGMIREEEGLSVIVPRHSASNQQEISSPHAWITIRTNTSLEQIGITAKISSILAKAEIPCNVVAGYHHDHLFVPYTDRLRALSLLSGN